MRGPDRQQAHLFSYVSPERRVPADHPLRPRQVTTEPVGAETVFRMPCTRRQTYGVFSMPRALEAPCSPLRSLLSGRRALIVTTPTVYRLHGGAFRAFCQEVDAEIDTLVLSLNEELKTHASAEQICRRAIERGLDRRSVLVAIGGGVCTDLTSYAASLIRRGIECIRIPTTVIGQVDAGIGVKAAVNFDGKKSYLGCMSSPTAVLLDPAFLRTLPRRHFQLGLAEIIKIALVSDAELFALVEAEWPRFVADGFDDFGSAAWRIIVVSAQRMLEELKPNLFEDRTYRRLVDAGHTFSPLIEAASDFTIHHGEAVSIDLCLSATIAALAGIMRWDDRDRVVDLIRQVGLPTHTALLNGALSELALIEAGRHRGGQTNLVLPDGIGSGVFVDALSDLRPGVLAAALERLAAPSTRSTPRPPRCVDSTLDS